MMLPTYSVCASPNGKGWRDGLPPHAALLLSSCHLHALIPFAAMLKPVLEARRPAHP